MIAPGSFFFRNLKRPGNATSAEPLRTRSLRRRCPTLRVSCSNAPDLAWSRAAFQNGPGIVVQVSACALPVLIGLNFATGLGQQLLHTEQTFIALESEIKRLTAQALIVSVEKCDHWARLTKVLPGTPKHGVLSPELLRRNWFGGTSFSELLGPGNAAAICS